MGHPATCFAQDDNYIVPKPHRAFDCLFVFPEGYAAQEAGFVGDDLYVFGWGEVDFFGVAAAEVEVIPVEGVGGLLDGFLQKFVPVLLAVFFEAALAEVVLVGLLLPGVVAELEAGAEPAVCKEG